MLSAQSFGIYTIILPPFPSLFIHIIFYSKTSLLLPIPSTPISLHLQASSILTPPTGPIHSHSTHRLHPLSLCLQASSTPPTGLIHSPSTHRPYPFSLHAQASSTLIPPTGLIYSSSTYRPHPLSLRLQASSTLPHILHLHQLFWRWWNCSNGKRRTALGSGCKEGSPGLYVLGDSCCGTSSET